MADPTNRGMFEHEAISLFDETLELISRNWKFTVERYPNMPGDENSAQRVAYMKKHCLLHIQKSLGILADELENFDHNEFSADETEDYIRENMSALREQHQMLSIIKTSFRLASILGLSGTDLVAYLDSDKKV